MYGYNLGLGSGGNRLPRTGLIWYAPDGVDTINLTAAALWAALPAEHRSIYFSDPDDDATLLDDTTIITNIEASPYLNDGGELIGNSTKGYAQYTDGASVAILNKALKYFNINTEMLDTVELLDSLVIIGA